MMGWPGMGHPAMGMPPPWPIAEGSPFMMPPMEAVGGYSQGVPGYQVPGASSPPTMGSAGSPPDQRDQSGLHAANMSLYWGLEHFGQAAAQGMPYNSAAAAAAGAAAAAAAAAAVAAASGGKGGEQFAPGGGNGAGASQGSSLHDGSNRCSPCAWVWKPKGCASGAECNYCHLCPEGELKRRKKAKIAALRLAEAQAQGR